MKKGTKDPDTSINIFKKEIENGLHKCAYCGESAHYLVSVDKPCCQSKAKLCPSYTKWFSNKVKEVYKNNPEYRIKMSKVMKEVHNRPEVKEKKRQSMLTLHYEDCEKCKEFQKNYTDGQKRRSDTMKDLYHGTSGRSLEFQKKHKAGVIKRSEKIHEKRHSDSNEAKEYQRKRINKFRQKYINKLNEYGILNVNRYSYGKLEKMYRKLNYYIRCGRMDDIISSKICR